ncbi:hypothetical protein ECG_07850 [Echinococcus granulosus]|nr:hypothetical protein ECG_07850 [Echinococcus granulosus]
MSIDLVSLLRIVEDMPSGVADDNAVQELRKYLSAPDSAFESLSSQTIFLSKLAAKLFSNPTLPSCYDLLLFATSKARADIWFEVLVLRLQQNGSQSAETKLCLSLLLKYLLNFDAFLKFCLRSMTWRFVFQVQFATPSSLKKLAAL